MANTRAAIGRATCAGWLAFVAAACSATSLQPGTTGVAGATGTAGTTGAAGGNGACLLEYNSALVGTSGDPCCAWSGGPSNCDPGVSCNDTSGQNCCVIYATSATVGGMGCCLYAGGSTPRTGAGTYCTAECASLLAGAAGTTGVAGTTGTAGTTGGGGSTGTGGTNDAGLPPYDAGAPTCAQKFAPLFTGWMLGFQPEPAQGSFNAVVSEVAADRLVLRLAGGESVTFRWSGPSLADEFSVAENVSCERTGFWSVVKGARRAAEIHVYSVLGGSLMTSGTSPGGISWMLETDCAAVSETHCVGALSPVVQTYYRVLASRAGDSVAIPMLATVSLGASQVTNVHHDEGRGGSAGTCHIDFVNLGVISVLGPP